MLRFRNDRITKNSLTRSGDSITVVLAGPQSDAAAKQALSDFKHLVNEVSQQEGHAPYVYVNVQDLRLSDVGLSARLAMKDAFRQPYQALAAVGKVHLLEMAMYLINTSGARQRVRYFTNEYRAQRWLRRMRYQPQERPRSILLAAYASCLVGLLALVGWAIGNSVLTRLITTARPINPMAAVGLLLLAISLAATWHKRLRLSLYSAASIIILGVLALLPNNWHLDTWLFAHQVHEAGAHTALADTAAVSFLLFGLVILLQHIGTRLSARLQWIFLGLIVAIGLWNAYGLAYAPTALYSLGSSFVMALPLSITFIICGLAYGFDLLRSSQPKPIFSQLTRVGWLIAGALLFLQITTYTTWQSSTDHIQTSAAAAFRTRVNSINESLTSRLRVYTDVLHGFNGLFIASDFIDQGEFDAYYHATNVATQYPGLRTVSFIAQVPTANIPSYLAIHRSDTSIAPAGHPDFHIQNQSKGSVHYLVTYIANTTSSPSFGLDLADNASRARTFAKAALTNRPVASGTITFGDPAQSGFFVTVPVQAKSSISVTGFVNVVFTYHDLFANLLQNTSLTTNVGITIYDAADLSKPIYTAGSTSKTDLSRSITVAVADRQWHVVVTAPANFATDRVSASEPTRLLIAGQLLTILLGVVFFLQSNARHRALALADSITADLQYERDQAVQTQQKDEAIFGSIAEGLIIFDKDARINRINEATENLLGYSQAELSHGSIEEALPAFTRDNQPIAAKDRPVAQTMHSARATRRQIRYKHKDGRLIDIELVCSPLITGGKVQGVVEIFRDITEQQRLERLKSEFVSLASHQLRTPISAISWFAEMLLNNDAGVLGKTQSEYVQQIYASNRRSAVIVDAMLLASGLELGDLPTSPQLVDMQGLCRKLIKEQVAINGKNKKLTISQQYATNHTDVYIDPALASALVGSIIGNAIKYTPANGKVTITVTADDKPAATTRRYQLYISVSDTGYGIPKTEQKRVFEKLFRASNVKAKDTDGTGLDLYIAKLIADKIGGHIVFTSQENVGTTFTITLPMPVKPPSEKSHA